YDSMIEVKEELKNAGWNTEVEFDSENTRSMITVVKDDVDFIYEVRLRGYAKPTFAYPEQSRDVDGDEQYYNAEVFLKRGGQHYDLYGYDKSAIINDILDQFEKYLRFVHDSPGVLPWKMDEHDDMINTDPTLQNSGK
ncbi:MAG: choline transporter, partial [Campylobacterota bacterium]